MFSISLFDKLSETLFLVRDRFGVKPLLYTQQSNSLYYASEVRSLHGLDGVATSISEYSVYEYMRFGYVSNPATIYGEVKQVRPGCYLRIDSKSLSINEVEYWSISKESDKYRGLSKAENMATLESLISSSVDLRLRSDVENSIFLSGGIDSGLIAKFTAQSGNRAKALTIKFNDKKLDETEAAKRVAASLGLDHEIYEPSIEDYIEAITLMPEVWDRPLADPSTVPSYILCKRASRSSKVVLSADGGDEAFFGYNKHRVDKLHSLVKGNPFYLKSFLKALPIDHSSNSLPARIINKINNITDFDNNIERFALLSESFSHEVLSKIFSFSITNHHKEYLSNQDFKLARFGLIDFSTYDLNNFLTDDVLYKIDHAAMYNSIENREPMLDYRVVGLANAIQESQKISLFSSKIILRKLYRFKKISARNSFSKKKGFVPPLLSVFRNHCKDQIIDYISPSLIDKHGFFNKTIVLNMRDEFLSGNNDLFRIVWAIFVFQKWYSRWG